MVNKTALGLLGVVVVASVGVGILIGMQLGGTTGSPATTVPSAGDSTPTQTPTGAQAGTDSGATQTATGDESRRYTEIPARQFDEGEIAAHVATFVNEERRAANESSLTTNDATADRVAAMASDHSVAMANNGTASHVVEGVSTARRYKNHDLFDRCKFKSQEGSYIDQPDEEFELVGATYAGVAYEADGETQFNANERDVARAIVDGWTESSTYSERLLVPEPTRMGVGIEVTSTGKVYATVDVCA